MPPAIPVPEVSTANYYPVKEAQLAKALGVQRMTLRYWRIKLANGRPVVKADKETNATMLTQEFAAELSAHFGVLPAPPAVKVELPQEVMVVVARVNFPNQGLITAWKNGGDTKTEVRVRVRPSDHPKFCPGMSIPVRLEKSPDLFVIARHPRQRGKM